MLRSNIDEKYKWDVESILDEVKIEKIKASIDSDIASLLKYKGKIDQTNIEEVIEIENNISRQVELIYIYYSHQLDQDHGNTLIQGKLLQISNYYQNIAATLSFLTPELTNLDLDNIKIAEKYSKYISDLKKVKQHVLSKEAETIMAYAGDLTNSSYDIYSTLTNAEIKFEDINNFDNEVLKLNEANYSTYIYSYDRKLRENAFNSLMSGYKNLNLTISTILINHLKSDAFKYKSRGFNSSKQMYLYNNHITPKVFDNLIKDVNKSLKYNHEYLELRKQILEVEEIHLYDMYVPIINNIDGVYEYENACEMIKEAFAPLGEEYISSVNEMITNKSIDVYPNEGKRTGAYSGGSYDSKSYVLLNYTNTLNDVFTLAHEVGHSMHSNFAKTQEYMYANYKIFVAEIASTVNELLLLNNLLAKTSDKNIRKYLLSYNLDQYRTTVFRQIMFAEFEDKIHSILQNNEELQADVFNEEYFKINQKYFGDNVHIDEMIKYEWSRIPHFYYHFYVYQYATSFLVASMIVDDIINDSHNMVEKYKNFLKSGDSLEPLNAIRELGIDLEQDDVFLKALEKYKQIIEQLRSECGN